MQTQSSESSTWLHAENEEFLQGVRHMPYNRSDITVTLKIKYNINDSPLWQRLGCAGVLFVLLLIVAPLIICFIYLSLQYAILSSVIWLMFFIPWWIPMLKGLAILIRTIAILPVNYYNRVNDDWQRLLNEGTFLQGEVTEYLIQHFKYEFTNADGKVIKGDYRYRTYIGGKRPKQVRIWYVDDKLHTLL